ncbi:MAG: 4Fe-4S binding protein [Bacilli bacterium]|nr:4Fe-4S binding protein [Bacilli bacterium]
MPRRITDLCIACGTCQAVCPVDCISEGDIYKIDEDKCIDCGSCQEECPTEAIIEVNN